MKSTTAGRKVGLFPDLTFKEEAAVLAIVEATQFRRAATLLRELILFGFDEIKKTEAERLERTAPAKTGEN